MTRIIVTFALLCCAALATAADVQAVLAGTWKVDGMVNLDQDEDDDGQMAFGDMPKMDAVFAGDTITMTMNQNTTVKITWKVLAEKPEGIDVEMTGGFFGADEKAHKSQVVVLEDGIVLCENRLKGMGGRMGTKFVRADGKPPGLPPSLKTKKPALVIDPNSPEVAKQFISEIHQISINRTITFEDGDLTAPKMQKSSEIQLQLSWPKGLTVLKQHKEPELLEAVTDAGESLVPPKTKERNHYFGGHVFNNRMQIQLSLTAPAKPAKVLSSLRAVVRVVCEREAAKPLEFKGIATWVGKEQTMPGGGVPVTIVKLDGTELVYRFPGKRDQVMKSVVILDAAGKTLSSHTSNTSSDNDGSTCTIQARKPIPADATVRFTGIGVTAIIEIPVAIKNIPLGDEPAPAGGANGALF